MHIRLRYRRNGVSPITDFLQNGVVICPLCPASTRHVPSPHIYRFPSFPFRVLDVRFNEALRLVLTLEFLSVSDNLLFSDSLVSAILHFIPFADLLSSAIRLPALLNSFTTRSIVSSLILTLTVYIYMTVGFTYSKCYFVFLALIFRSDSVSVVYDQF